MQWFKIPEKIYFQPGSVQYLSKMPNISRAFIVTDKVMVKLEYAEKVLYHLRKREGRNYVHSEIFDRVQPDPTVDIVREGVMAAEAFHPDVIIALGGGSAIDAAKAIWLFYEHPETNFNDLRMKFMDIRKRVFKYPHTVMDKVKRPKKERYVGKFLKQAEVVALFEAVKGHKLELGGILGVFYGLRRGEIVGLKWEAIDFEANTITIEHTVTVATIDGKRVVVEADTTKSKSSYRTLPLVPQFRAKLLAMREEQQYYKKLCGKSYNKKQGVYIYVDQLGNRIKPDYLTRQFPEFMVEHDFRKMRFHDLRHSCASLLLACGVPLKQIQEWLGHSDFAITANTYAHLELTLNWRQLMP